MVSTVPNPITPSAGVRESVMSIPSFRKAGMESAPRDGFWPGVERLGID